MNAKARTARQIVKARRTEARDARRTHTLASHGRRAGLDETTATNIASTLRSRGKALGILGKESRIFRRVQGHKAWRAPVKGGRRFTVAQFLTLVTAWRPRKAEYKAAKTLLLAY